MKDWCYCGKKDCYEDITTPIVHSNGSGKENLLRELREAANTARKLLDQLRSAFPHGRDYYVSKDERAYEKARAEWIAREEAVGRVLSDLEHIVAKVYEQ